MDTPQLAMLAREFSALGTSVRSCTDTESALRRLTRLAVDAIPDASSAGVTIVDHGAFRTICPTDALAEGVDRLQHTLGEGPGVQVLADTSVLVADDLRCDRRWPLFAEAALAVGVHAVMSFALRLPRGDQPAALNIYAEKPFAFAAEGVALGSLMVAHMDVALAAAHAEARAGNLERALESNREIGVAMGILMARHHVTEEESFALLRRASQSLNRKIRDLADQVTQTGELPVIRVRGAGTMRLGPA